MSEIFEFTEDLLLKAANHPIKISQLLGYLPLSLKKDTKTHKQSLHFSWSSIPNIGAIGQILIMTCFVVLQMFCFNIRRLENTQFDGISMGIISSLVFTNTFIQRFLGLYSARHAIDLWKFHCHVWSRAFQREIFESSTAEEVTEDWLFKLFPCFCCLFLGYYLFVAYSNLRARL